MRTKCALALLLFFGTAAVYADSYLLSEFLNGFVEDFDVMEPDGPIAPGDETSYGTVMPGSAFALIVPDEWPSNAAFNMGFTEDAGKAQDRALGVYCTSTGDER